MSLWWWLAILLAVLVAAATLVDVFGRRLGGWRTAAWAVAVLVFPFAGSAVYWIVRSTSPDEVERAHRTAGQRRSESERRPFG
jgi:hypothetical protein